MGHLYGIRHDISAVGIEAKLESGLLWAASTSGASAGSYAVIKVVMMVMMRV
jgi:hypothetical protein